MSTAPTMAEVHGPLGIGRRVPDDRRMQVLRGHPALGAALADWHVEYYAPPAVLAVHLGPDGAVTQLEAHAHPDACRFYLLSGIHLRDLPGVPPARLELPHFTHELVLWTLDPVHQGYMDALPWPTLQPHSISVQFECDDDDQAVEVFEKMAWGMVNGLVPADPQVYVPELGAMRTLAALRTSWTDAVRSTAEHARTGGTHDLGHEHG